jgi:hypothetical protein
MSREKKDEKNRKERERRMRNKPATTGEGSIPLVY